MCYPCTRCNRCGRGKVQGICLSCGHENPPGSLVCEACGKSFPRPPGVSAPSGNGYDESNAEERVSHERSA